MGNPLRDPQDRRLPRIPEPCALVIFGVTGDLSRKKLIPAVYDLANRGLLPPGFVVLGFARRDWGDGDFESLANEAAQKHARTPWREDVWQRLSGNIKFVPGSFDDDAAFDQLAQTLDELRDRTASPATPRSTCPSPRPRSRSCSSSSPAPGMADNAKSGGWRRVVVEKPFGNDLKSAMALNALVDDVFTPQDVFRIDHYLGKETVQNILALRFANTLFEPVWNSNYVDSVQITMAEDVGIGTRAAFYDTAGAARDVLQNHLMQLLALVAMEEPTSFDRQRDPGREAQGAQGDQPARRHRQRHGARAVPARLGRRRAGRRLPRGAERPRRTPPRRRTWRCASASRTAAGPGCRSTSVPASACPAGSPRSRSCSRRPRTCRSTRPTSRCSGNNQLVIRVQPDEGVVLKFGSKVPGTTMEVRDIAMDFQYGEAFTESSPEAYERLVLDVLVGDRTLFPDAAEVEAELAGRRPAGGGLGGLKPEPYRAGEWGPRAADEMLAREGRALEASMIGFGTPPATRSSRPWPPSGAAPAAWPAASP